MANFVSETGSKARKVKVEGRRSLRRRFGSHFGPKNAERPFGDAAEWVFWSGLAPPSSIEERSTKNEVRRTKC